jgi:hypothetical protein
LLASRNAAIASVWTTTTRLARSPCAPAIDSGEQRARRCDELSERSATLTIALPRPMQPCGLSGKQSGCRAVGAVGSGEAQAAGATQKLRSSTMPRSRRHSQRRHPGCCWLR